MVEPFLYNSGNGKKVPISQLIRLRNKEKKFGNRVLLPKNIFTTGDEEEFAEDIEDVDNKPIGRTRFLHIFSRFSSSNFRNRSNLTKK